VEQALVKWSFRFQDSSLKRGAREDCEGAGGTTAMRVEWITVG